jgi:hypothetical protein
MERCNDRAGSGALTGRCQPTQRAVIGDQLRKPVVWCQFGRCIARYDDPEATGEQDVLARAVVAGWRQDALGRLACPACTQQDPSFWTAQPLAPLSQAAGPPFGASTALDVGAGRGTTAPSQPAPTPRPHLSLVASGAGVTADRGPGGIGVLSLPFHPGSVASRPWSWPPARALAEQGPLKAH